MTYVAGDRAGCESPSQSDNANLIPASFCYATLAVGVLPGSQVARMSRDETAQGREHCRIMKLPLLSTLQTPYCSQPLPSREQGLTHCGEGRPQVPGPLGMAPPGVGFAEVMTSSPW